MKIRVRVRPNSKTEEVVEDGDILLLRVKEPATEGKANRAATRLLARHLNIPGTRLRILSGFKSRIKVIEIG
ncbi:MAG: DUF167 domain-containing protein [Chloroflexi bacterium]|nr:DUF167 domain-containing protein [Chloroflexota bacterium]